MTLSVLLSVLMGSSAASSAGGNYQKIETITTNNVKKNFIIFLYLPTFQV
jgi:hypothetical protein